MRTHTCSYFAWRRCVRQRSSGGVHKLRYTTASVPNLKYTSAVINRHVRHARDVCVSPGVLARSGSMIASVKTLDHVKTRMILLCLTRCVRQAVVVYIRLQYTIGSIPACIAQIGGAHVFPDVLATLGSTIGPMTALVHAPVPRLVIVRHEARAAIERRWCV